jgi:hypothetical protein
LQNNWTLHVSTIVTFSNYDYNLPNQPFNQVSNKIKNQLFGILNFGHCDLPFDLAQGGGELVEPFGICVLLFEIF